MIICRVTGTVVCTQKDPRLAGVKFLLVQPLSLSDLAPEGKAFVAIDTVGAGMGEVVMVVSGSSARQTQATTNTPTDASIMGIVDTIDSEGQIIFTKTADRG